MDDKNKGREVPMDEANVPMEEATPEQQQLDPKTQREVDAYTAGLSRMLHNKKTSSSIVEMLQAGEPEETIPQTALLVNSQMETAATKGGKKPSLTVLLNAGVFLCSDLIEIGNAAGIFQLETAEQVNPIVQKTMQTYIEKGLADGTIDPVELQAEAEQHMTPEQRDLGMQGAKATGISLEADDKVAMQAYGSRMERKGMLKGGRG